MKPKTHEEVLDLITAVVNNYCNNDPLDTPRSHMKQIQRILEEEYMHGSLDNNYK